MAFMGNNFNRFDRDVMRMEVASSDMKLREADREQSAKDHGSRIAAHLAMLIGVLLLLFLVLRPLFGGSTEQEKKDYFYQFTAEKMMAYKPGYFLYEELSDPAALLKQQKGWSATVWREDDPQIAAALLLGEGCTVQTWSDLIITECDRMWEEWYYGTEDITSDNYILREIDRRRAAKTLPGLGDDTWLVTDGAEVQHILIRNQDTWATLPLEAFR